MKVQRRLRLQRVAGALVGLVALALPARAQESVFALQFLGVSQETGDGRARGLGVLGVALDDPRTSIALNPAALGRLDFMTLSAMAVAGGRSSRTPDTETEAGMARFPHQRFAVPLFGKVVFTTGLVALRNFHGEFTLGERDITGLEYQQRFERDGTLYTIPLGVAGALGPRLAGGLTVDFVLGTVDEAWVTEGDSIVSLRSRRRDEIRGETVTLGLLLRPLPWLGLGGTWSPEFLADRKRRTTVEDARATTQPTPLRDETVESKVRFPQALRLGLAAQAGHGVLVTGDWLWREWEAYDGSLYEAEAIANETRFGGGVEWAPPGRLSYRVGASRWTWPQELGGARLRETSLHVGMGLALARESGRFDVALEYAWSGDLETQGLEERVLRVVVSLSGQERWRRKSPRS